MEGRRAKEDNYTKLRRREEETAGKKNMDTWIQPSIPSTQQILTQASLEHSFRQWRMQNDNSQHLGNYH